TIRVQPFYLPHPDIVRPYLWGNALALFCLVTVVTTAVMMRDSRSIATQTVAWRGPFGCYWHEQWITLVVLSFATLKSLFAFVKDAFDPDTYTEWNFGMWWGMIFYDVELLFGMFTLTWIITGLRQWLLSAERRSFAPLATHLRWPAAVGMAAFI